MLTYRKSKSGENISIYLKNDVGIEEAAKMKKYLIKGLSDNADVQINLEKATDLHISILQLMMNLFLSYLLLPKLRIRYSFHWSGN